MKKLSWIYNIRGLAILAVVICHQQGILHMSEWVQMFTLFSVTTLILLAGITQTMWLTKKNISSNDSVIGLLLKKVSPLVCSYIVGTMAYLSLKHVWTGQEINILWDSLLNFSACDPFYFIRYFIALTLISPLIFFILKKISGKKNKLIFYVGFVLVAFLMGYWLIDKFNIVGQSYLSIYVLGMIFGQGIISIDKNAEAIRKNKMKVLIAFVINFGICLFAINSVKVFYFRRVQRIYEPTGIDVLVPKLQMNPPNLSIILYSLSVFFICASLFYIVDKRQGLVSKIFKPLEVLGKYSMDIFIWHLFVQNLLMDYVIIENIWIKRIVYYMLMLYIPVIGRVACNYIKKGIRVTMCKQQV